jgi:hypothetical protein
LSGRAVFLFPASFLSFFLYLFELNFNHLKFQTDLAGGPDNLYEKLKGAYEADKIQWAVQLADALIEIGKFEREAKVYFET